MDEAVERPKRLSLSQILELMLTRGTPERSAVTLTRNASGETQIEVTVRTGDDGDTVTVEDAEAKAQLVYDRLRELYPQTNGHENATVELTRNAKGETQIEVQVKTSAGGGVVSVTDARDKVTEAFRDLRSRFPLSTGERVGFVGAAEEPTGTPKGDR